jgi:hypothetical protein
VKNQSFNSDAEKWKDTTQINSPTTGERNTSKQQTRGSEQ